MTTFKEIGPYKVDCLTHDEALEIALLYAEYSGKRYKVIGNLKQHDNNGHYIGCAHLYCYEVLPTGDEFWRSRVYKTSSGLQMNK